MDEKRVRNLPFSTPIAVSRNFDPRYLGFFRCFNEGLYYEAHEVLEPLWLTQRASSQGAFFKGLIQLAGAFVHLQKQRPEPAMRLLKLAQANLRGYPTPHQHLDLVKVQAVITEWLNRLGALALTHDRLIENSAPNLQLLPD